MTMPGDRPNVLQIVTDQQQARALGVADSSYSTPNLDRLAGEGVRFIDAYCTHAQCTPSRSSVVTGQYPHQTGCYTLPDWGGYPLEPDENPSVGRVMDRAGYDVAWSGKWHLGANNMERLGWRSLPGSGDDSPDEAIENRGDGDGVAAERALRFLAEYDGDEPFFLTVSYRLPHPRWYVEGEFADRYSRETVPIPDTYYEDSSDKPEYIQDRREYCDLSEAAVRDIGFKYRTMVSQVDAYVGRLLDELGDQGLRDETAVVFHSDHGDMQGAHGINMKGSMPYEEIYRIPLIVDAPGVGPEREVVDDLVTNAAVPGTILDLAGAEVPPEFEGGSLVPAMRRGHRPDDEAVFFEHKYAHWGEYPFRGVRIRDWKYVEHLHSDERELYDMRSDPEETNNLAPGGDREELIARLQRAIDHWWDETGGDLDDWLDSPVPDSSDEGGV
jgi:arylsulfatase A-like enzyme